jgi:RND family efflux transporter MFP subunit
MKRFVMAAMFIAIAASCYGAWWWWQQGAVAASDPKGGKGAKGRGGALIVKATTAVTKPMPVLIEAVGTVEPEHSVQVRAQVSGVLEAVKFKEGDTVQAGQLLFEIDRRTFLAAYNQAQAQLARDQAQLENARVQRDRLEPLLKREFITQQEFDVAVTSTKSLEATVAADRALVEQARIQLEFSTIRAPIAGRTGSLAIKPGNLVPTAGGGVPLVTINSTDPILVSFSIPERQLEELRRNQNDKNMRIEILTERSGPSAAEGKLVFIDNTITPQTGTVLLKTRVSNKNEILWPGQFANVRIVLRIEAAAVVIPENAVQPGQDESFVYLIDQDSRVQVRPIKIARQIGGDVVIAAGVAAGDRVITEIPQALQPGAIVQVAGAGSTAEKGKDKGKKGGGKKGADKTAGRSEG